MGKGSMLLIDAQMLKSVITGTSSRATGSGILKVPWYHLFSASGVEDSQSPTQVRSYNTDNSQAGRVGRVYPYARAYPTHPWVLAPRVFPELPLQEDQQDLKKTENQRSNVRSQKHSQEAKPESKNKTDGHVFITCTSLRTRAPGGFQV